MSVIEAAYSLEGGEMTWLANLAASVRDNLDQCRGVRAYSYDVSRDKVDLRAIVDCDVDRDMADAMASEVAFPSSELGGLVPLFRRRFVAPLRSAPKAMGRLGISAERVREFADNLEIFFRKWKLSDHIWINAQDPTFVGCLLVAPVAGGTLAPREVYSWQRVATHVSAAFRVRRQLAALHLRDPSQSEGAEAILGPGGTLEHATGPARESDARSSLRAAVLAVERARGPLRRTDPEQAVQMWQGLVAGRWSLLDHFDSDGRRFIVAHRNDATVPDLRGLTMRECQVLGHVALGASNKMNAYELGLAMSTVASYLASARSKLGLPSTAALRATFAGPPRSQSAPSP
jgi:DNA-binding CsgD family transcriptional regulator